MIEGTIAIFGSALAFLVPLAVPLMTQRWLSFLAVIAAGAAFFAWLHLDIQAAAASDPFSEKHWLGPFVGGLMLFGFAAGVIARLVMLIGGSRKPSP